MRDREKGLKNKGTKSMKKRLKYQIQRVIFKSNEREKCKLNF